MKKAQQREFFFFPHWNYAEVMNKHGFSQQHICHFTGEEMILAENSFKGENNRF